MNLQNKLLFLLELKDLTRPELVELTKLPRTTIYDSLKRLEVQGKIIRYSEKRRKRVGRPKAYWRKVEDEI